MELRYKTFIMPHIGDKYSQCADRFAIGTDKNCFAIADGVGESLFPYDWAELVCEDFIANPNLFCENNKLVRENALIEAWNQKRDERTANLTETELFLYEMGLEKADFAACTFVGLSLDKKQWQCLALGDSYLFVLDNNLEIIESVASQKGEEFSNFPEYFASQAEKNHGKTIKVCGDINKASYFVLLTDAISDWFIKVDTEKRRELLALSDMQSFHSLVNKERENGNMKDDDTTAVIIEVVHNDSDDIKYTELHNSDIHALIIEEEKCIAKKNNEIVEQQSQENIKDNIGTTEDEISVTIDLTDSVKESTKQTIVSPLTEDLNGMQMLFFEEISNIVDCTKKGMYGLSSKVKSHTFIGKNRQEKNYWNDVKRWLDKTIIDLNKTQRQIENLIEKMK